MMAKTKAMAEEAVFVSDSSAIGLTDHGYLFGAFNFWPRTVRNAGVKPTLPEGT